VSMLFYDTKRKIVINTTSVKYAKMLGVAPDIIYLVSARKITGLWMDNYFTNGTTVVIPASWYIKKYLGATDETV